MKGRALVSTEVERIVEVPVEVERINTPKGRALVSTNVEFYLKKQITDLYQYPEGSSARFYCKILPILHHFAKITTIYCRFFICEHLKKINFAVDARIFHFRYRHILPLQTFLPQYIGGS